MDDNSKEVDEFELHRSVFNNDLKKLTQILKNNKEIIDKKVNFEIFFQHTYSVLFIYYFNKKLFCIEFRRINMETQLYI